MALYCPRCGNRDVADPRFCYLCSDGVADEVRAAEVVDAAMAGIPHAARVLEDITDPRAFEVVAVVATAGSPDVRRRALSALSGIGDPRGIPAAAANLADPDGRIREAAIIALADMGAADMIAERLDDPVDRIEAAKALAWLGDERAFEPLAMALDTDAIIQQVAFERGIPAAMARLGGIRALEVLDRAANHVLATTDQAPEWQRMEAASSIAQALIDLRLPEADRVVDRLRARFGRLYAIPAVLPEPYVAPPHARRTVPRWSLRLVPTLEPITEPIGKFGGQPVWIEGPAWPAGSDGEPATFLAQVSIPGRPGLVYVFLDPSDETYLEPGVVFAQPGRPPARIFPLVVGPTFASDVDGPPRYRLRRVMRMVESRLVLEPGLDFDDWQVLYDDPEVGRDDERDWNKVGGNPRWLQSDDMPDEPGWQFVFQFTTATIGREMGEGAECYGLLNQDGRGRLVIQSH